MNGANDEKILIISNNVLSQTSNNGKTLLSYFKNLNSKNIYQLYFSEEIPQLSGYHYYKLSDKDILKGYLNEKKRGMAIYPQKRNFI
mgnify:CR=1 FL=1